MKTLTCPGCGYPIPETVPISGYDTSSTSRHIHCPRCGKKITYDPERFR